jgi:hypothetical protein
MTESNAYVERRETAKKKGNTFPSKMKYTCVIQNWIRQGGKG